MPGSTLPNIGIVLPSLGGDEGIWDDELNDALTLIDDHDHTAGKGALITTAALDIDDDLSFGGNDITALGKIGFTAITAPVSGSKNLFVNSADNELYWRTNSGSNVKLTDGNSINTTLVGGIVGDYTSVGAEVAYDDANDRYTFKQQSGTWARIACGGLRLFEFNTTESLYTALVADPTLSSSYTITLPAALPGSTQLLQMNSSGSLLFSNTGINSITMVTNASITVSGTGDFKHGTKTLVQASRPYFLTTGAYTASSTSDDLLSTLGTGGDIVWIPVLGLRTGDQLISIKLYATATNEPTVEIVKQTLGSGAVVASTASGGPLTSTSNRTYTLDSPETITGTDVWFYALKITSGSSTVVVRGFQINYTRP